MPRLIEILSDGSRVCSRCGTAKPSTREFFRPDPSCRDGLSGTCRPCFQAHKKAYRERHRERLQQERRDHYARTKGLVVKERRRRWLEREPVRARARMLRAGLRDRAKKLGIPVDFASFTVAALAEWLESQPTCPCCGVSFELLPNGNPGPSDGSPSLDRIKPADGYVVGNVALLCWRCNNLKRDATADELQRVVDWMRTAERDGWGLGHEARRSA